MDRKCLWARSGSSVLLCVKALALLLFAAGLSSCESAMQLIPPLPTKTPFVLTALPLDAIELPFESIEKRHAAGTGELFPEAHPEVKIVANLDDSMSLGELISLQGATQLRLLDYVNDFAFIIFQGWRGCAGPSVEIKQLIRQKDTVHIYAYFIEIPRGQPCPAEATSPYHLVKVRKDSNWSGEFTFILYDNDRPVAKVKHFIP